jgi:hypothetical protein
VQLLRVTNEVSVSGAHRPLGRLSAPADISVTVSVHAVEHEMVFQHTSSQLGHLGWQVGMPRREQHSKGNLGADGAQSDLQDVPPGRNS